MSNIILHVRNDEGKVEEIFLAPSALSRWCLPPVALKTTGQLPTWCECLVTMPDGLALPVLEDPHTVAALHAKATQCMFWGWNYAPDTQEIWMYHYERGAVDAQSAPWPGESERASRD